MSQRCELSSFMGWLSFVGERKRQKELVARILRRLEHSKLNGGFFPLFKNVSAHKAREEELMAQQQRENEARHKRHDFVVDKFRRKLTNKCVFVTLAGWQGFVKKLKWERLVVARFAKKMSQRQALSSFLGWLDFIHERKRVKALLGRILGRLDNQMLLKGFAPWLDHFNEHLVRSDQEAEQQALQAEAEKKQQRHDLVVDRFRRKLTNKCLFMTYAAWQTFLARVKWERIVVARFAKKMSQRCELSSFAGWVDFVHERKRIKALLARILGRLDNQMLLKGFAPWLRYVNSLKSQDDEAARKEAEEQASQAAAEAQQQRHQLVVDRFRRKLGNKSLFVTWSAWQAFIARLKWERIVVARFAKKMSQRRELSSFAGWLAFIAERKRIKALLARILGRLDNQMLLKGFAPWLRFVDALRAQDDEAARQDAEEQARQAEAEAQQQRHQLVVDRFRRKLGNKSLFVTWSAWQAFVARVKWERVTLARFAKKMSQRRGSRRSWAGSVLSASAGESRSCSCARSAGSSTGS